MLRNIADDPKSKKGRQKSKGKEECLELQWKTKHVKRITKKHREKGSA